MNNRIIIIYWNFGIGGIQKRIRDLIKYISRHYPQWNVYLLLKNSTDSGLYNEIKNIPRLTIKNYLHNKTTKTPLGFIFWVFWQYYSIKPNVVLTFGFLLSGLIIVCKFFFFWFSTKIIINEGAVASRAHMFEGLRWSKSYLRLIYNKANKIIVPTQSCKDDLIKHFNVSPKLVIVIPNWTMFHTSNPRLYKYDVIFVGRFDPEKNPLGFISIVKQIILVFPTLRVCMVGDGILLQNMKDEIGINLLQKNITILPYFSDIRRIYNSSRVLVVPSFNEGMPNVVLEAAMSQTPSVIRNFPGSNEVVLHGKTGYIYTSNTNAQKYILRLLNHEEERKFMGTAAQQNVISQHSFRTQLRFIDELIY